MFAVMQRLQREIPIEPVCKNTKDKTIHWQFSEVLPRQNRDFFQQGILRHGVLTLEYSVLCTQLMHEYTDNPDSELIQEQLVCALMMAEYLTYIYHHFLAVPREVERLQNEQKIYRFLLEKKGYTFLQADFIEIKADSFSQLVRSYTVAINAPRLFSVRVKRLLEMCVPFILHSEKYCKFIKGLNTVAKPFFTYFAWIFFLPRLVVNVFLLLKHLIPGFLGEKERELGFIYRLQAQLQRRWFELANDSVWAVAGLLTCFVLTGPLAPAAIYMNVSLYVYDIATATVRACIEVNRLQDLIKDYELRYQQADAKEKIGIARFLCHLERRVAFEQKKMLLGVINTSLLAIAISSTLPFFVINPLIPLIGAAALVMITVVVFAAVKWLDSQKPNDKIGPFFKEVCSLPTEQENYRQQNLMDADLGNAKL